MKRNMPAIKSSVLLGEAQRAPQGYFLGNCSCVALPPTLTSMDGGNAKELFGTILAM